MKKTGQVIWCTQHLPENSGVRNSIRVNRAEGVLQKLQKPCLSLRPFSLLLDDKVCRLMIVWHVRVEQERENEEVGGWALVYGEPTSKASRD
jgi:hypothetical protein